MKYVMNVGCKCCGWCSKKPLEVLLVFSMRTALELTVYRPQKQPNAL